MKNILVAFMVSFSLIGCSISEQIIFNEDGSGKLSYTVDMSKMIAMTKDLDKSDKMTKELTEGTDKDIDSVIVFKDLVSKYQKEGKEITAEQLANMEQMKNYSMRILLNKEKSEMKYIMYTDFSSIAEVGNVGSALSIIKGLSGKKTGALDAANQEANTEVKFSFDGKEFSRSVEQKPYVEEVVVEEVYEEILDTAAYEMPVDTLAIEDASIEYDEEAIDEVESEENVVEEEMSEADIKKMEKDFKQMGEMMKKAMEDSAYEFQYTFTRKIKNVSLPKSSYKLSDDKKTIFIKYKFEEFTKKIKDLNLSIAFE